MKNLVAVLAALLLASNGCATGGWLISGLSSSDPDPKHPSGDSGGCGVPGTLIGTAINGVGAGAILIPDNDIGTLESVALGFLAVDTLIAWALTYNFCTAD